MLRSSGPSLRPSLVFHFTEILGPTESGVATRNSVKGDSGVGGSFSARLQRGQHPCQKLAQTQAIISAWLITFPPC